MRKLRYLDGFSGYGGFHKGLEAAGFEFEQVYFSEIDKHAIANYSYNYPNSIYVGSITTVSRATIGELDLFTFGWPCQDNSIAGKRKGQQAGTRSGLLYEAVRVINECRPRHFIAENVKGLYSVNKGVDFRDAVEVLAYLNESCPQYDIEMQLCNTRWVLPQNRERLYFVGHLRGTGCRQIFPIGEEFAISKQEWLDTSTSTCISALTATDHKGPSKQRGNLVIPVASATKQGYEEATEGDSINFSVPGSKTHRGRVGHGVAQTLDTACNQGVVVTPETQKVQELHGRAVMPALRQGGHNSLNKKHSHSLVSVLTHYGHKDKAARVGELCPTLKAQSHGHEPMVLTIGNTNMGGETYNHEYAGTIRTNASHNYQLVNNIRRLTPIECERLQGLPDNWTKYGVYNDQVKEISDTQRYKLCGNGVTTLIVKMIAKKLKKVNYDTNRPNS